MSAVHRWVATRFALALAEWAGEHYECVARWDYAGAADATKRHAPRLAFWAWVLRMVGD